MELSPFVLLTDDSDSVIDLEIAIAGDAVTANAAAPPISISRRVNSAIISAPCGALQHILGFTHPICLQTLVLDSERVLLAL